jgi:hypothetical protein
VKPIRVQRGYRRIHSSDNFTQQQLVRQSPGNLLSIPKDLTQINCKLAHIVVNAHIHSLPL